MPPKPFAFVLMPFHESFDDTYQLGIKGACEEAGYYCERLDEQIFESSMLDRIYNQIAKADLVVADLTGRNVNVFYETGYAHALGKRVILLTRTIDDIPFDLKHHFHIVYSDGIAHLRAKLRERASYYLQHPLDNAGNPFSQMTIVLNGQSLGPDTDSIAIRARSAFPEFPGISCIDASFHFSDGTLESREIEVRLITSELFPSSGWHGSSFVYTSIAMPDGRIMHKPLAPVRIAPSDPDTVTFDLRVGGQRLGVQSMTLRLICSGLVRDLELSVKF